MALSLTNKINKDDFNTFQNIILKLLKQLKNNIDNLIIKFKNIFFRIKFKMYKNHLKRYYILIIIIMNNNNNNNNLINLIKKIYNNNIYKSFLVLKLKISEQFNNIDLNYKKNNIIEFKNNINKYNNEFNREIFLNGLGSLVKIVEQINNILDPTKYDVLDIKLKYLSKTFNLNQTIYNLTSIFLDNINNIMKSSLNNKINKNDIYTLKKKIFHLFNNLKNDIYDVFYINFIEDVLKMLI